MEEGSGGFGFLKETGGFLFINREDSDQALLARRFLPCEVKLTAANRLDQGFESVTGDHFTITVARFWERSVTSFSAENDRIVIALFTKRTNSHAQPP
jgi:hypothetical protein